MIFKNNKKAWLSLLLVIIVGLAGYFFFRQPPQTREAINSSSPSLEQAFDLVNKEAGTKLYYSPSLGLGFTYRPDAELNPAISESAGKISVDDQSVEVFVKDPASSLEQAIAERFLVGYDPTDCFVQEYRPAPGELLPAGYQAAVISFPPPADSNEPWWQNSVNCPAGYSQTNSRQYFLMNPEVPDKFIFLSLGQAPAVFDGASDSQARRNWSDSLRILD